MQSLRTDFTTQILFIFLLGLAFIVTARAMPLPSETSDLVLVCRGYPYWPYYRSTDKDNALIINYQNNKIYWYGDITDKRIFNTLDVLDENREKTLFGGTNETIDIALARPDADEQGIGKITKSSHNNYIAVTIGDYYFRAHCIFYSPADYNKNIMPQFVNTVS